ncbi:MAG: TraB/GumN family protein [Luteimonas sp.]
MKLKGRLTGRNFVPSLLLALSALAFPGAVLAEQPQQAAAEALAPAAEPPVPLLWKATAGERSVYLLGSFHLLKPDDYPLSPDVDAAFADSDSVVFEIPPEELQSPELGIKMGQAAMRTDGTVLDSALPEETVAALTAWTEENTAALQQLQLSPQVLQMFDPWFVSLMVTIIEMGKYGLDPELGLDNHLATRAGEAGKETGGLETADQQIAFFTGMSDEEQVQFLQSTLDSTGEEGRAEITQLHDAWRSGNAQVLWDEMAVEMRAEFPAVYQRINVDRNDAWVPQVEAMLDPEGTGNTLLVVGALHLVGEDGVVEKLEAKGYEVERICSACP